MAKNSIGLIELTSVAAGFQSCDAMLKAADVELVLSRSICSGKYMVMVRGDVAAVEASVAAGIAEARFAIIDSFVIANLHESVFPALSGVSKVEKLEALGIVESFSVAALIEGADAAVKTAALCGNARWIGEVPDGKPVYPAEYRVAGEVAADHSGDLLGFAVAVLGQEQQVGTKGLGEDACDLIDEHAGVALHRQQARPSRRLAADALENGLPALPERIRRCRSGDARKAVVTRLFVHWGPASQSGMAPSSEA